MHLLPFASVWPPLFSLRVISDLGQLHFCFLAPWLQGATPRFVTHESSQPASICEQRTPACRRAHSSSFTPTAEAPTTADDMEEPTARCPEPFITMRHEVQRFCQPGCFSMCRMGGVGRFHFTGLKRPPIYGALKSKQGQKEYWLTHCESKLILTEIGREHGDHRKWNFRFSV